MSGLEQLGTSCVGILTNGFLGAEALLDAEHHPGIIKVIIRERKSRDMRPHDSRACAVHTVVRRDLVALCRPATRIPVIGKCSVGIVAAEASRDYYSPTGLLPPASCPQPLCSWLPLFTSHACLPPSEKTAPQSLFKGPPPLALRDTFVCTTPGSP